MVGFSVSRSGADRPRQGAGELLRGVYQHCLGVPLSFLGKIEFLLRNIESFQVVGGLLQGVAADSWKGMRDSKRSRGKWHASDRIISKVSQTMSNCCKRPGGADFITIGAVGGGGRRRGEAKPLPTRPVSTRSGAASGPCKGSNGRSGCMAGYHYRHGGLDRGIEYDFRGLASNAAGDSLPSNVVTVVLYYCRARP